MKFLTSTVTTGRSSTGFRLAVHPFNTETGFASEPASLCSSSARITAPARKQTTSGTLTALFLDQRSGLPSDASGIGRMARDLSAFFKIANLVNSFHDVETLQRELLGLIFEVIPATQGAIVLQVNANEEPNPPCTVSRDGDAKLEIV